MREDDAELLDTLVLSVTFAVDTLAVLSPFQHESTHGAVFFVKSPGLYKSSIKVGRVFHVLFKTGTFVKGHQWLRVLPSASSTFAYPSWTFHNERH